MTVSPQAPTDNPDLEPQSPDDPMAPIPGVEPEGEVDPEENPEAMPDEPDVDPEAK
jgi:hypothetical protein